MPIMMGGHERQQRSSHPPKYLSTDNDPLFTFRQWQANLRILEIMDGNRIAGDYFTRLFPFR